MVTFLPPAVDKKFYNPCCLYLLECGLIIFLQFFSKRRKTQDICWNIMIFKAEIQIVTEPLQVAMVLGQCNFMCLKSFFKL